MEPIRLRVHTVVLLCAWTDGDRECLRFDCIINVWLRKLSLEFWISIIGSVPSRNVSMMWCADINDQEKWWYDDHIRAPIQTLTTTRLSRILISIILERRRLKNVAHHVLYVHKIVMLSLSSFAPSKLREIHIFVDFDRVHTDLTPHTSPSHTTGGPSPGPKVPCLSDLCDLMMNIHAWGPCKASEVWQISVPASRLSRSTARQQLWRGSTQQRSPSQNIHLQSIPEKRVYGNGFEWWQCMVGHTWGQSHCMDMKWCEPWGIHTGYGPDGLIQTCVREKSSSL